MKVNFQITALLLNYIFFVYGVDEGLEPSRYMNDMEVIGHGRRTDLEITQIASTPSSSITGSLPVNQLYYSSNQAYVLVCQVDGNLVIYGPSGAVWSTGTHGNGDVCIMQNDGNLVIYNSGSPTWWSGTHGNPGAYLVLTDAGTLVLYDQSGGIIKYYGVQPPENPTRTPTEQPTKIPTRIPTNQPTKTPTRRPTDQPTELNTVMFKYLGCFWDDIDRALQHRIQGQFNTAYDCNTACHDAGFKYSGRQYLGECWCGNSGYDKHGSSDMCNDCDSVNVGGWLSCVYEATTVRDPETPYDVIIVGSGWAGVAAAKELTLNGVHNFIVLEARDYIGGRSRSVNLSDGQPVDLGSMWVTDIGSSSNRNPVHQAVLDSGVNYSRERWISATYMSYGDGTLVDESLDRNVKQGLWEDFLIYVRSRRQNDQTDVSLRVVSNDFMNRSTMSIDQKKVFVKLLESRIVIEYGASLEDLSTFWYDNGNAFNGGGRWTIVKSYGDVIQHFATIVSSKVSLNSIVNKINYNGDRVEVTFNKDNQARVLGAKHVIVTVPLGVLKDGMIQFEPSLPDATQTAIDNLAMGTLDKVIFAWNAATQLPWSTGWVQRISNDIDNQGKWNEFYSLNHAFGGRPILVGFAAGRNADDLIENVDDTTARNNMLEALRKMFGAANVPEPEEVIVKRWKQDPFARGSYSTYPTNSRRQDRQNLGNSINDKIYFAGEAVHLEYWGYTHGALLSGIDAAEEVINILQGRKRNLRGGHKTTLRGTHIDSSEKVEQDWRMNHHKWPSMFLK